jgi:D-glycerate 3-kinase
MNINGKTYSPIKFDDLDFERLMFLHDLKDKFGRNYYTNNKLFFEGLNKKGPFQIDSEFRFSEFCEIYKPFSTKFNYIYKENHRKLVEDLYGYYIPLSRKLYHESNNSTKPMVIGIQAHQGCGKTTFCDIMKYILNNYYNVHTKSLSIDDIYLPHSELQKIKQNDPRFKYRGPPGTHDLSLGIETVQKVRTLDYGFELPKYDKKLNQGLGDRCKEGELIDKPIDVFILEGWFLGAEPVGDDILRQGVDDEAYEFRKTIRDCLVPYTNIWRLVDQWIVLRPLKFKYSRKWRVEAERVNKQGMSYKQINEFVDYFWNALPPNIYFDQIDGGKNTLLLTALDRNRNIYISI